MLIAGFVSDFDHIPEKREKGKKDPAEKNRGELKKRKKVIFVSFSFSEFGNRRVGRSVSSYPQRTQKPPPQKKRDSRKKTSRIERIETEEKRGGIENEEEEEKTEKTLLSSCGESGGGRHRY